MIELVLAKVDTEAITGELTNKDEESCAILYANETVRMDGTVRLLVREIEFPIADDYSKRGHIEAELKPEFVARITKRARKENYSIVFVHSHPGHDAPTFSRTDSIGEKHLARFLAYRHPKPNHLAFVISLGGMRARRLGTEENVRIISIGTHREVMFDAKVHSEFSSEIFDRQIRAFGAEGQSALHRLRIGIVGLGGTGSLVAQQLAHLGIRDFILIDPDTLESTNLNRVVNALPSDLGQPKVEIAAKYIRAVSSDARVACIQGDVIQSRTAKELQSADIIFGCTD